jgi:hypothetical protein
MGAGPSGANGVGCHIRSLRIPSGLACVECQFLPILRAASRLPLRNSLSLLPTQRGLCAAPIQLSHGDMPDSYYPWLRDEALLDSSSALSIKGR